MKKTGIAIVALLLLYPAGSWLMGFAIEQRVDSLADQGAMMFPQLRVIDESRHGGLTSDDDRRYVLGSTLKVSRHYHRGWFVSVDEATVEVSSAALDTLPALKAAASAFGSGETEHSPLRFSVQTVIHHGPVCGWTCFGLAGADAHVKFEGPIQAALGRIFGSQEPITIRSRFAFFGGGSSRVSSPAFELPPIGQGGHLAWGGIDSSMHYGARQDWYDIVATAPAFHVEGPKGAFELKGMSLTGSQKRLLRTLYGGDARAEVQQISVTGPDHAAQLAIRDLLFQVQSHADDRFVDVSYQTGSGAIVTQPLRLSSAHMDITLKHLDMEALESLTAAMREAGQGTNVPAAPAARAQELMAAIKKPMQALLLAEPEMDLDRLSAAGAQGQGSVSGAIRLTGLNAADLEVPGRMVSKLDVRLDIAIDEAFLASLPSAGATALTRLQPMVDQGYVTRANGALHTQVLFRGGSLSLNGKPFNPAAARPGSSSPSGPVP